MLLMIECSFFPGSVLVILPPEGTFTPLDCLFFNFTRTVGCGSGIVTIFKNCFNCKLLLVDDFFKPRGAVFKVELPTSVLCALVYRPPESNSLVPHTDRLLTLSDFNIHVCCQSKPPVKEFYVLWTLLTLSNLFLDLHIRTKDS